jgi:hypothetical protein
MGLLYAFDFKRSRTFNLGVDTETCSMYWDSSGGYDNVSENKSLNDLVSNWEEGEVSFIEALCKAGYTDEMIDLPIFYGGQQSVELCLLYSWIKKPTSQRLTFLFGTLKHLL